MHQRLRPVGHRVLIELIDPANQDESTLIHVPEAYKDQPLYGVVKGIGNKCEEFAGQVGDTVMFDKFSGNKLEGFPNVLIMHEKNILGIVSSSSSSNGKRG